MNKIINSSLRNAPVILSFILAIYFLGHILPYGKMIFWGSTVITNFMSAIPWVGKYIVEFNLEVLFILILCKILIKLVIYEEFISKNYVFKGFLIIFFTLLCINREMYDLFKVGDVVVLYIAWCMGILFIINYVISNLKDKNFDSWSSLLKVIWKVIYKVKILGAFFNVICIVILCWLCPEVLEKFTDEFFSEYLILNVLPVHERWRAGFRNHIGKRYAIRTNIFNPYRPGGPNPQLSEMGDMLNYLKSYRRTYIGRTDFSPSGYIFLKSFIRECLPSLYEDAYGTGRSNYPYTHSLRITTLLVNAFMRAEEQGYTNFELNN